MIAKALLWHDLFGLFSSLCLHLFLGQHGHNMSPQGVVGMVGMRWSKDEWIVRFQSMDFVLWERHGAFSRDMLEHQTGELPTTMEPVKPNQPTPTNVAVKSETWGWTLRGGCSISSYSPLFLYYIKAPIMPQGFEWTTWDLDAASEFRRADEHEIGHLHDIFTQFLSWSSHDLLQTYLSASLIVPLRRALYHCHRCYALHLLRRECDSKCELTWEDVRR